MEERLTRVVGNVLKRGLEYRRDEAATLRDLGLGSLRMIQLIQDLEQEFAIRIEDDEVEPENFDTLGDLRQFIDRKQAGR
ncbi:MAG: acyl carrier protein [Candidatus Eisenbacteria bacterium]|nr:acyl carrier protein [Candidatus Eisenbacteria bacterium]